MTQSRTSTVPLRPLGAAEILDGAVRAVWANARTVLAIAVPFAVAGAGLDSLIQLAALNSKSTTTVVLLGGRLISLAAGTLLTGMLAPVFSGHMVGRRLTVRAALSAVGRAAFGLLLLGIVVTVAEGVGLALFVVGGVWLWGIWAVAAPALVLERTGVIGALRRSWQLVAGHFWRTWGIRALGWVLTSVLGLFIRLPFVLLAALITQVNPLHTVSGASSPTLYVTITAIGTLLGSIVLGPIGAAIDVLIYSDLRMRKEGMDIVMGLPPAPPVGSVERPAVTAW
ncbi:MAG TPA: hypothetical protein VHS54_10720 [Jatrophihabitans sp.]|jgi:hypothetical protein|nr:hypothetical protein [Jatrophihabitans sp.]